MKNVSMASGATIALVLFFVVGVAFAHEKAHEKSENYGQKIEAQAGEYSVTLGTNPVPAKLEWNKMIIWVKDAAGQYVTDAKVAVEYKMDPMAGPEMFAGPSKTKTVLKGNAYHGDLKFSMEGTWHLKIQIARGGKVTDLYHDIYVLQETPGS